MIGASAGPARTGDPVPGKWRAAAFYLVLTLVLTYPLSVQPHRTMLARNYDDELFMWTLAWDTHAFVHQPLSIFDANIFYPKRRTLAYSENLIGSAFFAAPVLWLTGNPVLALNVVALLACVLCGLGGYVLGRRVGLSAAGALICGVIFAFSPARFFRTPQIHVGTVQWIPFTLASLHAYLDRGRKQDLRLAVAFFSLQALTSGHGAVFLTVAVVLLIACRVALGDSIALLRRVRDFGFTGALLLLPAVLIYMPYRAVQAEMGLRRGLGDWWGTSASFLASPTRLHMWLRPYITDTDVIAKATGFLFIGYLPLLLALIAVVGGRRPVVRDGNPSSAGVWHGIALVLEVSAVAAFVVASAVSIHGPIRLTFERLLLNPPGAMRAWIICAVAAGFRIAIAGRAPLDIRRRLDYRREAFARWAAVRRAEPATYYVLLVLVCALFVISPPSSIWRIGLWPFVYAWPGFSFIRVPMRFIVLGVLAVAVLGGMGFDRLSGRLTLTARRVTASIVLALLVAEFAAIPLDTVPYRVERPAVDRWIAGQPKPFVVVELPVFEPDQPYHTTYMLHSTVHWQKTVHGYSGILPASHEILYRELGSFPNDQSLRHLKQMGVTYVILHATLFPSDTWKHVEDGLRAFESRLKLEYTDGEGRVYSLR
jgi:hypothetical protein